MIGLPKRDIEFVAASPLLERPGATRSCPVQSCQALEATLALALLSKRLRSCQPPSQTRNSLLEFGWITRDIRVRQNPAGGKVVFMSLDREQHQWIGRQIAGHPTHSISKPKFATDGSPNNATISLP
eukprot:scaffold537259_cov19-Prasinocladus_malaysianus.AAC.1